MPSDFQIKIVLSSLPDAIVFSSILELLQGLKQMLFTFYECEVANYTHSS